MKKRIWLVQCLLISASAMTHSQTSANYKITFRPMFGHSVLHLEDTFYELKSGDSVRIDVLKFYITGLELLQNETSVYKEPNSFHLLNAQDTGSLILLLDALPKISFNKIKFNIGIDSLTNSSGALGGDLDPMHGMYWTWQNGYINFKLEGISNICNTRKNEFQFHLGGYSAPFNALQTIVLQAKPQKHLFINIDLEKLANSLDLSKHNHIMSPCNEAVSIAGKVASVFSARKP